MDQGDCRGVQIRFFGSVGPVVAGETRLIDGQPGLLLALLGARYPDGVSAGQLADALWPDGASRSALHVLIGRLRRSLGDVSSIGVLHEGDGYRLSCPAEQMDTAMFVTSLTAARSLAASGALDSARTAFDDALALWAEPFGRWSDHPRLTDAAASLHELHDAAEEELSEVMLSLGEHESAVERLASLAGARPLRERRWTQLMTALYRSGRQAEALRCAQRARSVLGEEVGLEPGPGLIALERAIFEQSPSLVEDSRPVPPRLRMPSPATSFVGRELECRELASRIAEHRLVTVWGPGGIGKSRIAVQVVAGMAAEMPDGATVVPLASYTDFGGTLSQIGMAIGVTRHDHHSLDSIIGHLRDRRCILVLDNCEHLGSFLAVTVARLLRECAGVRIVATSQRQLGLLGECRWKLHQMSLTTLGSVGDAEQLFMERAQQPARGWADPATLAAVTSLCQRLDGLPLALELAAARTPTLCPADMVDRLPQRFELLRTESETAQVHHQTLLATIEWSHALLSDPAGLLLDRLSVFVGPFTADDAEAVCCDERLAESELLPSLDELVAHSLVHSASVGPETGFRLFESIRAFGAARLDEDEASRLRRAHRVRLTRLSKQHGRLVLVDAGEAVARLAASADDLRAAIDSAIADGDNEAALDIANELTLFWMLQGGTTWGRSRLERAMPVGSDLDVAQAKGVRGAAILAAFDGDNVKAEEYLSRALAAFESLGSAYHTAWTRFWFGRYLTAAVMAGSSPMSRLNEARDHHRAAIARFRESDDVVSLVMAGPFAGLCFVLSDDPAGEELIIETYRTALAMGVRRHRAATASMYALCLGRSGDLAQALDLLDQAVKDFGDLGDYLNESISGALRVHVLVAQGEVRAACHQAAATVEVHQRHGDREWEPYVLGVARVALDLSGSPEAGRLGARLDAMLPSWSQPLHLAAIGRLDLPPAVSSSARPAAGQVSELASLMTTALAEVVAGLSE